MVAPDSPVVVAGDAVKNTIEAHGPKFMGKLAIDFAAMLVFAGAQEKKIEICVKAGRVGKAALRFLACGVDVHTEDASIGEHLGVFEDGALCLGASHG